MEIKIPLYWRVEIHVGERERGLGENTTDFELC